jgi:hypothetical protein
MEALPMTTQLITTPEGRTAQPGGFYEASQAERHAEVLGDLILDRTLSADGMATAHGARGLLYALLALRESLLAATADTADAVTDLDVTLGIIAGAVTDAVTDELPADPRLADTEP